VGHTHTPGLPMLARKQHVSQRRRPQASTDTRGSRSHRGSRKTASLYIGRRAASPSSLLNAPCVLGSVTPISQQTPCGKQVFGVSGALATTSV
jgi:hypothetical protein